MKTIFPRQVKEYEEKFGIRFVGWYNVAQAQWRARRFDAALKTYQQALDVGISQPEEVHLNRSVILAQHLGRIGEAVQELERALASNPR